MSVKISQYIKTLTYKRLSLVDCDPNASNQHEIGGGQLKKIYGNNDRKNFHNKILYLSDRSDEDISEEVRLSFYDTRKNNPDRSPEFRLVYQNNIPMNKAQEGDLIIFKRIND